MTWVIVERFGGLSTGDLLDLHGPRAAVVLSPVAGRLYARTRFVADVAQGKSVLRLSAILRANHHIRFQGAIRNHCVYTQLPSQAFPLVFPPDGTPRTHVLQNGNTIEPLSPRPIDFHTACVKIVHTSGTAELLKEIFRDTALVPIMTAPRRRR